MKIAQGITRTIQALIQDKPQAAIVALIMAVSALIYLSNGDLYLASNDNVPSTILAFNWLENHTLTFDNFRNSYFYRAGAPYFFTEAPNGHLVSTYPIGSALVTFPLYLLFFLYLKLAALLSGSADLLAITRPEFEPYRREFGKLAAVICSALSVGIFYLAVRLKFQLSTSLIASFLFAFATSTWALNSQDLRQHTVSNLLVLSILLCLWKANFLEGKAASRRQKILLITAGFLCGLLPGVRLTSAIFSAAAFVFVVYVYRRRSIFFLLGLPSLLFNFGWNIYHFSLRNFLGGGYGQMFDSGASSYRFSLSYFAEAFAGQLISPSDGLIPFSPVFLFALPGFWLVWQRRAQRDEQLLLCLTFACIGLLLHYCVYVPWTGGSDSYGARFLTDVVPIVSLLVTYAIDRLIPKFTAQAPTPRSISRIGLALFSALLILSTGIQAVGAFTKTDWGSIPLPLIAAPQRIWQLRDSQIERHTRNLIAQIAPPIRDRQDYLQGLTGAIDRVEWLRKDGKLQPIEQSLTIRQNYRRFLKIRLNNTGQSRWYGYETGMYNIGETRIRLQFFNQNNRPVLQAEPNFFAISGIVSPGETAESIGQIVFPRKPGIYEARFSIVATGIENLERTKPPIHTFSVTIAPRDLE